MRNVNLLIAAAVSTFCLYGCMSSYRPEGKKFAQMLIAEAIANGSEVTLGDPRQIRNRFCFGPNGNSAHAELKEKFSGLPVVYAETDDSNKWYVAMHAPDRKGIIILGVTHNILRWNDYSSAFSIEALNLDADAKTVCVSSVRISYFGEKKIPTFRPKYETEWSGL